MSETLDLSKTDADILFQEILGYTNPIGQFDQFLKAQEDDKVARINTALEGRNY